MGVMITAQRCCGFKQEILIGQGMMGPRPCYFPFLCKACGTIEEADLLDEGRKCSQCGSPELVAYDDRTLIAKKGKARVAVWDARDYGGRKATLTNGKYYCPNCKEFNLTFLNAGLWD